MPAGATLVPPRSLLPEAARITELYAGCFAGPPWHETAAHVARFAQRLPFLLRHRDVRVAVSRDEAGRIVSVAIGLPAADVFGRPQWSQSSWPALSQALSPWLQEQLLAGFYVMELMVDPASRRQGRGMATLQAVTGSERAWLLTHRDADACALYYAAGWTRVAAVSGADGVPLILCSSPPADSGARTGWRRAAAPAGS